MLHIPAEKALHPSCIQLCSRHVGSKSVSGFYFLLRAVLLFSPCSQGFAARAHTCWIPAITRPPSSTRGYQQGQSAVWLVQTFSTKMMACVSDPKRGRGGTTPPSAMSLNEEASGQRGQLVPETPLCHLLLLPEEVVEIILSHLDARTLVRLEQVCSWFRRLARGSRMSITEKAAKEAVLRHCHGNAAEANRWRCGKDTELCFSRWQHRCYRRS
jgi:hypothetical protein